MKWGIIKVIRKRMAWILIISVLSLTIQSFDYMTARAEQEIIYCTTYDVCRPRQIGNLYFNNIKLSYDGSQSLFTCDVTNMSATEIVSGEDYAELAFYKDGEEMIIMLGFFGGDILPGETHKIVSGTDMNIMDASFLAMGIWGKKETYEIIKIDTPEFEKSRVIEDVLLLNEFELCKISGDSWRFRGKATALANMYGPYQLTFTFIGDDNRTEKYDAVVQLDKDGVIQLETYFRDMHWVKNMEVTFEKDVLETVVIGTDAIEEMIPNTAVKFTTFEITKIKKDKYWSVKPQYIYEDKSYRILQAYYEILDADGNVLMVDTQNVNHTFDTVPELETFETDAHMEKAVRARVYFTTRLFFYPGETPGNVTEIPTEEPTGESTETPTSMPTQKPTDAPTETPTQIPTQKPTDDQNESLKPSPAGQVIQNSIETLTQKTENDLTVFVKAGKIRKNFPVLKIEGRESDGRYEIYRSLKRDSGYKKVAENVTGTYTDKKAKAGKTYYYKVRQVVWRDGKTKMGEFTREIRIVTSVKNIPKIRVRSKRYSSKLNYAEIQMKQYQGNYLQIFYRKPDGKFQNVKLKENRLSKKKKVFRISYRRTLPELHIKVRTYDIKNGKKQFSKFSRTIRVRRNGKISVIKDSTS